MTLKYFTGDYEHESWYEYEVDYNQLLDAVTYILSKKYKLDYTALLKLIDGEDLVDPLLESLEEEIKDYFREDAFSIGE